MHLQSLNLKKKRVILVVRPCLQGGRVTLLGGLPFSKSQNIGWSVFPRATSANKHNPREAMFINKDF